MTLFRSQIIIIILIIIDIFRIRISGAGVIDQGRVSMTVSGGGGWKEENRKDSHLGIFEIFKFRYLQNNNYTFL